MPAPLNYCGSGIVMASYITSETLDSDIWVVLVDTGSSYCIAKYENHASSRMNGTYYEDWLVALRAFAKRLPSE